MKRLSERERVTTINHPGEEVLTRGREEEEEEVRRARARLARSPR